MARGKFFYEPAVKGLAEESVWSTEKYLNFAPKLFEAVRAKYGLSASDADEHFGVVCVSPSQNLYTILAEEQAANRIEGAAGVAGVFANPKIEPFGPPRQ